MRTYKRVAEKARKTGRAPAPAIIYFPKEEVIDSLKKASNLSDVCIDLGLSMKKSNLRAIRHLRRIADFYDIKIENYVAPGSRGYKIKRYSVDEIARDMFVENSSIPRRTVKLYLVDLGIKKETCEECGCGTTYNKKQLVLELHHVNGINNDNRISNLQLLCPNCHSQTNTFKGKNVKR